MIPNTGSNPQRIVIPRIVSANMAQVEGTLLQELPPHTPPEVMDRLRELIQREALMRLGYPDNTSLPVDDYNI